MMRFVAKTMKDTLFTIILLAVSTAMFGQQKSQPDPAAHQQLLDENKGWMSKVGLGKELPDTYKLAVVSLMDSILANGVVGTPENPASYRGYTLNNKTHQQAKWIAINVKPGVWEISVNKPIYGETDFPVKITVSKTGVVARFDTPEPSKN